MVVETEVLPLLQWLLPGGRSPGLMWLAPILELLLTPLFYLLRIEQPYQSAHDSAVWLLSPMAHAGALLSFVVVVFLLAGISTLLTYLFLAIRHGPVRAFFLTVEGLWTAAKDLVGMSPRRVGAMARLAFQEAIRLRVLVVFAVFAVVLLLGGWFLTVKSDYPARQYLNYVLFWSNFLALAPVLFLSTFSLPADINSRTLHTVTTKPVRASEIILGRVLGFIAIGTLLLSVMCFCTYFFVVRGLAHRHTITPEDMTAVGGGELGQPPLGWKGRTSKDARHWHHVTMRPARSEKEPDLIATGRTDVRAGHYHLVKAVRTEDGVEYRVGPHLGDLQARVPVYGKLSFLDRRGRPTNKGINVGNEWTYRSYIEGDTPMAAIWRFEGITPERFPDPVLERLVRELEALAPDARQKIRREKLARLSKAERAALGLPAARRTGQQRRLAAEAERKLRVEYREIAEAAPPPQRARARKIAERAIQRERNKGLPLELNIRVFRTYKGDIERGIEGSMVVISPDPDRPTPLVSEPVVFQAREFTVDRKEIPRRLKVVEPDGTLREVDLFSDMARDGNLILRIRCSERAQYYGVAQADVYFRAGESRFGWNFVKSYVGIWLQMVLLACLGVMFSTFLSGPVAWLATLSACILGFFAQFVEQVATGKIEGGGPTESAIRTVRQIGVMTELDKTTTLKVLRTFDWSVMDVIQPFSHMLPHFGRFDCSKYVVYGYNIPAVDVLGRQILVALAYVVVVSCLGYFLLKSREIAA